MADETDKKAEKAAMKAKDRPSEKLKSDDKQTRLAEALRANLRRRKSQSRERKDD